MNLLVCPALASPSEGNSPALCIQESLEKSPLDNDWVPFRIKVIDFGLAEGWDPRYGEGWTTSTGGTCGYLAPESKHQSKKIIKA